MNEKTTRANFKFLEFLYQKYNLKHPCLDCILRPMRCNVYKCSIRNEFWDFNKSLIRRRKLEYNWMLMIQSNQEALKLRVGFDETRWSEEEE